LNRVGSTSDRFDTRAADLIHRVFLVEEEYRPLPPDPSPAMLVARVSERLSLAAAAVGEGDPYDVVAYLLGAAGFALTAITCIDPDQDAMSVTEQKDLLLGALDEDVLDMLETACDVLNSRSLDELLRMPLCAMTDAYQCVAELEGVNALCLDGEDWEEEEDEVRTLDELLLDVEQSWKDPPGEVEEQIECREQLLELIADSLWDTAVNAAGVAELLAEGHEALAAMRR
jgi:hypothetical protein